MGFTMAIIFKKSKSTHSAEKNEVKRKGQRGHVLPRPPVIDLNQPGRLRTANILALVGISHATLYARMRSGAIPRPDGKDGGLLYWKTQTIKEYLDN